MDKLIETVSGMSVGQVTGGLALIYGVSDNDADRISTTQACRLMKDKGCTFAMNMDGAGRSSGPGHTGPSGHPGRCPPSSESG